MYIIYTRNGNKLPFSSMSEVNDYLNEQGWHLNSSLNQQPGSMSNNFEKWDIDEFIKGIKTEYENQLFSAIDIIRDEKTDDNAPRATFEGFLFKLPCKK